MTDLPYRDCAGVVLINDAGLIWIGERIEMQDAWQMPQGGIDKGETAREAALRELEEETGLARDAVEVLAETADWVTYDLPPEVLGRAFKGKYRGQRQKWFLMRLTGDEGGIDIERAHPEFSRWTWAAAHDVIAAIVAFKRPVYEAVLGEFAPYLAARDIS